jgi:predicted small lipoprotein YifL
MKNLFKLSFLALAISLSVAACDSAKKGTESADSTTMADSSSMMSDSTMMDSSAMDSTTVDTVSKM